jgi:MFS family permease
MTTQHQLVPEAVTTVGRWQATAVFFLNGLAMSTFIVLMPALKVSLNLTDGQLGIVGMVFAVSALTAMQFVGALVSRVGTRPVLRASLVVLPLLLAPVGMADGMAALAGAAVALGLVHGTTDAAMNANAIAVERRSGRSILHGCHAAWSVSAVAASLCAAGLAQLDVPIAARVAGISAVLLAGGLALGALLPPSSVDGRTGEATARASRNWRAGWSRPVVALGLAGMAIMLGEGAALGWGAVFLIDSKGASVGLATTAVTAFTAGQAGGRLIGDRLTDRYGAGRVFRTGACVAAVGFATAILAPHAAGAIVAFAVAGFGGAVLVPLVFSSVGHLAATGSSTAVLVSRLTTFIYAGVLLGPGIIGGSAELIGLTVTLSALAPLLLAVAVLTRLPGASPSR